jgi:hypothetical protein
VFAAPTSCETIIHPKGEVIELTVMTARNIGVGLNAEEQKEDLELETTQKHKNDVLLLCSVL